MQNPFRYFNSSPEIIRLAVMMYVRYPLSLRQVEDLLVERGIDISHGSGAIGSGQCSRLRSENAGFITGHIQNGGGISMKCSFR